MMTKVHTKCLGYVTSAVLFAASLTSCNRAEYAMLPKTSSYHGTASTRAVATAPVAPEAVAPATVEATPVAAPATEVSAPQTAAVVAAQPVATQAAVVASTAPAAKAEVAKPAKAPKLNFMQKAVVQKVMKKADKLANKAQFKKHTETADTKRISGKLRTGLLLILAGLILELLGGISGLFYVLGSILVIVGIVVLILWLLDEL
ncbi:hypothetical protein [Hymenobacter sp. GOD-10R]|uniref:hypothetical protein n=1 Tax=Hymenobacter sp. GOD-10R TaxID=3093922 RepID=UPI002D77DBB2|nr:hypothetical protein [Hymenobacter sp. GOD-10R]WRQ29816.1 hypothetical protein SD425_05995 [Hymenobacter sp. GOD-10R]